MDATMMLCDYAESVNGKLYISGGGWAQFQGPGPFECALAVRIGIPWDQTNRKHSLVLELVDQDGVPVAHGDDIVRVDGEFEVGRPPGTVPGSEIVNTLAIRFHGLPLHNNHYRFSFLVDGEELAQCGFRVVRPAGWEPPNG
jgi:hypothetical protein